MCNFNEQMSLVLAIYNCKVVEYYYMFMILMEYVYIYIINVIEGVYRLLAW